jgi:hypothetical protein
MYPVGTLVARAAVNTKASYYFLDNRGFLRTYGVANNSPVYQGLGHAVLSTSKHPPLASKSVNRPAPSQQSTMQS